MILLNHLPLVAAFPLRNVLISEPWWAVAREIANLVNGSTLAGLALVRWAGLATVPGPRGVRVAFDYPDVFPAPHAAAVTIGNVILCRYPAAVAPHITRLLAHEERHSTQWALLAGPLGFLPIYFVSCAWSWLRCRDFYRCNVLEQLAGLADGGYLP